MTTTEQYMEIRRSIQYSYSQSPDWVTFYREILGLKGIIHCQFPTPQSRREFERSDIYAEIQSMLAKLRTKGPVPTSEVDPTEVITVRLPKSLHKTLTEEAHQERTSLNKLCITKLLQLLDTPNPSDAT